MSQCLFYENKPFTMAYIDDGYEFNLDKISLYKNTLIDKWEKVNLQSYQVFTFFYFSSM